jgi:surface polysaccharide O-acyltransferase-like enzyme
MKSLSTHSQHAIGSILIMSLILLLSNNYNNWPDRQMSFLLARSLGIYLAEDNFNDPHLMALTIYYAESSEQLTSSHEIEDRGMSPKENDG